MSLPFDGTIYKIGSRGHFFEMKDNLSLTPLEEYSKIHCDSGGESSGGERKYPSAIRFSITDYSGRKSDSGNSNNSDAGTGTFTVSYLVHPSVVDQMLQVCRANVGEMYTGVPTIAAYASGNSKKLDLLFAGVFMLVKKARVACVNIVQGKGHERGPFADMAHVMQAGKDILTKDLTPDAVNIPAPFWNFTYHAQKTNTYKRDDAGRVLCSQLEITRRQYLDNGAKSNNPWYVKIVNGYAFPKDNNGLTNFDPKTLVNAKSSEMRTDDEHMYEACWTCDHFIRTWENAYALPLILEGREKRFSNR